MFNSFETALEQGFVHSLFFPDGVAPPPKAVPEGKNTVHKALFRGLFKRDFGQISGWTFLCLS